MTDLEKMAREGYADLCSRWRAAIDKQENPEGHSLRALEDLARRAHAEGRREGLKEALAVVETRWKSKGGWHKSAHLIMDEIRSLLDAGGGGGGEVSHKIGLDAPGLAGALCSVCVVPVAHGMMVCDPCVEKAKRAESALHDSRVYVTEIASGVAHYSGPGGCGDPNPCVRCQLDAAKARLARLEEVEKAASAVQRELRPDDFMPNSVRVPAPTWDRLAEALARARE